MNLHTNPQISLWLGPCNYRLVGPSASSEHPQMIFCNSQIFLPPSLLKSFQHIEVFPAIEKKIRLSPPTLKVFPSLLSFSFKWFALDFPPNQSFLLRIRQIEFSALRFPSFPDLGGWLPFPDSISKARSVDFLWFEFLCWSCSSFHPWARLIHDEWIFLMVPAC